MIFKKNPLQLNKLQLRTLALLQILAEEYHDKETPYQNNGITVKNLPPLHGDHVHIGRFTVSSREISGFSNSSVLAALSRKKLIDYSFPPSITITKEGLQYKTELIQKLKNLSDH